MIAKGKSIQHGFAMLSYVLEKDKAKPIRFNNLREPLSPQDVWMEMELHRATKGTIRRNHNQFKCNTLRFEISPQNQETEGWTDDDYRSLIDELNLEMKSLNYDPNTGKQVHNFDLGNTQYIAAIHYDSRSGIRHIHVVANRIDMDGNVIDDHYLGKRLLSAVHAVNLRHGWILPEDIHEQHLQQINEACMDILRQMRRFSWKEYGYELSKKGIKLMTRKDSSGEVVAYNIMMGNSKFKASSLGTSRNLTAANIEKTWIRMHSNRTETSVSPSIKPETHSTAIETTGGNGTERKPNKTSEQELLQSKQVIHHEEYNVNDRKIQISIPKESYNTIKTEAEVLCKAAESSAEAITHTASLLFLGYVDAAVTLSGMNGGCAIPPSGGGGSSSGSRWGKDPKEDEREWARRCARQAADMCKPAPQRRLRR